MYDEICDQTVRNPREPHLVSSISACKKFGYFYREYDASRFSDIQYVTANLDNPFTFEVQQLLCAWCSGKEVKSHQWLTISSDVLKLLVLEISRQ